MFKSLIKTVFRPEEYTYEVINFNLIQLIYLIGLLALSGVIYICIPDPIYVYMTFLMSFLIIATIIDVNRTGRLVKCACLVSLFSNLLYLPFCYYGFGKLICCVPLYFILGILYTVLLIPGLLGASIAIFETIYMGVILVHIGRMLPNFNTIPPTLIDYIAISIGILVVGVLATVAIKTKVNQYDVEFKKMEDMHLNVIDAYNSKDIFFANTSHEIRTPLNAIVGTVNLLLDEDLPNQVKDNVYNILNSCNALLAITDELMELADTGDSDVSLNEAKYDLSEMLNEIVNMMSVRLMESAVVLYVEIDKDVPKYLYGDGAKVRQLFVNILNNAVKYTKEGHIVLRVKKEDIKPTQIMLKVEVEDTGIGIKEEVIPKLFDDYNRDDEDDEKRVIEGTGLGLSLCKELTEKMHGTIGVRSVYHKGSTFYFDIPQIVEAKELIATVNTSENTASIIYENDDKLAEGLKRILDSLSVKSVIVTDRMEFETSVLSSKFNYVFISSERYVANQRFIDRKLQNHRVIVLTDVAQSINITRSCYVISRPAHIINVSMAFNNETGKFTREIIQKGGFTCPNSTILVVDDTHTNLEVASGLLKKYEANIVTAGSGYECLNILETMHVDLIYMDYMMPEMNGIDTLYKLRALNSENAQTVPVIALSANVVAGAREMFMDAGFCEYIAKPIDVNKLEKSLQEFLPREQLRIKI